jgi:signal transduction histidine kinase
MRHSNSPTVSIRLSIDADMLELEISDVGAGFDRSAIEIESTGTGLRVLAERITNLQGRLHVVSEIGAGTTVRADLPRRTKAVAP